MKVCVTATSGNLDSQVDPRFGRCQYFVIVDSDTMEFEALPNTSASAVGGAGIQAAQTIANKGVKVVITGNVGPNAYQVLSAAGIDVITGAFGTVREVVNRFKKGELRESATAPTAPMGFGMGQGMSRGRGWGMGGGRGMGRGMRQFTPVIPPQPPVGVPTAPTPMMSREQEIQMLENQMKNLQQQLEQIKKRMEELKT
jgi:predicted Fe-Mo cluster-binding NifX family protein